MQQQMIYRLKDERVVRVLLLREDRALVIDCEKQTMPIWIENTEEEISFVTFEYPAFSEISEIDKKNLHEKYSIIAEIIPLLEDKKSYVAKINEISEKIGISTKSIREYLCNYLVHQDIRCFYKQKRCQRVLTRDEQNFRWALHKYFYTEKKRTLQDTYTMLLKEKYCDNGILLFEHPSFNQFRYFYRKHRKMQTYLISRNGIKDYQKNYRPLLSEGAQEYMKSVGFSLLDSTICDIYLVDDETKSVVVGRPILTAAIDGYSGLCTGFSLGLEGGMYSIRQLFENIVSDKVEICKKHGITIDGKDWDAHELAGIYLTDKGAEYASEKFEQITDLGVRIENLTAYRPDLKGQVEKFFDVVQGYFKKYLKGCGVIEEDFNQRGGHDYRKDASLGISDFYQVIIRCILYYNTQRIIENYPYSENMLDKQIKPYAMSVYDYGKRQPGANLITTDIETVRKVLMPRVNAKFTRNGLIANGLRYSNESYIEDFLQGKEAIVAFDPFDVTYVYLIENGKYIIFNLIQSRFEGKALEDVNDMKKRQKELVKKEEYNQKQSKIDLAESILAIRARSNQGIKSNKNIRTNRKKEIENNRLKAEK